MKRQTITTLYGMLVCLMVLALGIAYAQVVTELKIEGNTVGQEQEGVYITDVEYLSNNGADTTNSVVNYFLGTMLDSKVVLGSSSSSSITYQVTIKNNTEREQVFIGIIKDETNEEAYNNTSIQPNVETVGEITGLEKYVTTIAPGEYITFPVTYAYAGTDTANFELQGKINFRFREKPVLELNNDGETYTLENIGAGHEEEYEFTVSNYNETYTNGVPMTYTFATELTEGSPLEVKIYDSEEKEVTENITILGDGTNADHTYTLKLIWDSSLDSTDYEGKSYTCTVKLTAVPDTTADADLADYAEYSIEKEFGINITTCSHTYGDWEIITPATCIATGTEQRTCTQCGKVETEEIAIDAENGHNYVNKICTLCGDNINTAPTLTISSSNVTATTATITASGSDSDGDTLNYTLTINGQTYTSTTGTFNVTGLSEQTTYSYTVNVTDGYETVTKTGSLTTIASNTAPVIATNSLSSKTTTSITIKLKATDADGDTLTYKLYTSTSQNGTYTLKQTSSATAQNTQITLTASSLSNYTTYWWYITVTDGTATTTSSKQSLKTYCPGTGLACTATQCTGNVCTKCNGSGSSQVLCNGGITVGTFGGALSNECQFCGSTGSTNMYYNCTCKVCGYTYSYLMICTPCVALDNIGDTPLVTSHWKTTSCSSCSNGNVTCPTHRYSSTHYYCTTHSYSGTSSTHEYCSHGYTSKHDN